VHGADLFALRQLVIRDVLNGVPDRDDKAQVNAVFEWCKWNVRYIEDPIDLDLYPTALTVIHLGGGDCDCHTIVNDSMLAVIGFVVGAQIIETIDQEWHIYPLVWLPKGTMKSMVPMDTAWEGATKVGQEYPRARCRRREAWYFTL
jgi:hypothetical protein